MKQCNKCEKTKPISEFYVRKDEVNLGNVYSSCKTCWNENRNRRKRLKDSWSSLKPDYCECCKLVTENLFIEHQHKPFHFRGFVCESCNKNLAANGDTYKKIMSSDCNKIYKDYIKMAQFRMGEPL